MTRYAPLDADPPACGFCGSIGGPDGVLVTVGPHGGVICEECATTRSADARLLLALALRDQSVAAWLRERGVDEAAIRAEFGELDLGFE